MSNIFTETFSGGVVSPAEVAFAAYSFSTPLVLFWPAFSNGQPNVAARFMNLTATNNSLDVFMPDATLVSVGYDVIIFNAGSDTFNVVDSQDGAIATIAAGQTYYILLTDNTSEAGTWQTVQFGVGTSSASAAALAGAGLLAIANTLNVNFNGTTIGGSTTLTSAARAVLQVWIGGTGTITLPDPSVVGNGWFFPFANNGSGTATLASSALIDGSSTSAFTQTQSGFVFSNGSTYYTVGKGLQTNFAVTILNLNVAGNADVTETSAQAQNVIQQYTGVLTGNINVIVPATPQLYYSFNDTSGAFTLTLKTAAGTGIAIDQGSHVILYCDGTNIVNAFTSVFGGAISIAAGSPTSPNLNIIGSVTTGIYSPASNQLAVTANGKEVMSFISDASAVNYLESEATATGNAPVISAQGSDTNIGIILSPKGSGSVGIPSAIILAGTIDGTVIGGGTPAAITGTIITATTDFVGAGTGLTGTAASLSIGGNAATSTSATNAATATALQTARAIYGNNFDGTTALTQVIASTFGGTGNGFTKFSGPASSEKTFTLPNSNATILTDNALITPAQGGTGIGSYTTGDIIYASGSTTLAALSDVATGNALISGGVTTAPAWGKIGLATHVSGNLPVTNLNSGTSASGTTFWRGDGTWATPSNSGGTVTSIATGSGLTGGPITSTGTISLDTNNALGVGSYAMLQNVSGGSVSAGSTVSGSLLNSGFFTSSGPFTAGVSPSGTWRNVCGNTLGISNIGMFVRTA